MSDNRRNFLKKSALLGLSGLATGLLGNEKIAALEHVSETFASEPGKLSLPALPYAYDALEPFIDKQTMEIHHTKHHQAYIDKLNSAAPGSFDFNDDDSTKCRKIDTSTPPLIRNNMGGYFNHSLFWPLMKPNPDKKELKALGKLGDAINSNFKTFDDFKKEFSDKALKIFGSGWCWLIVDEKNALKITTTPNQDNPLMKIAGDQGKPVLCLDVWEHAYYLKYQNKRADYISNWWNVVNWEKAEELYKHK
ncbi:MAG: superoxide dismutase [bacterium]|nr:superoxide dismutase [bacterium]